uniref:Tectonic family member 1 n=1 Tax=Tetraodon nigroviridis TaxID=99883 RepID=H3C1R3_TETNG
MSSSCFHLILHILVFTRTNSLENASSLTSNATLGGPNVTNNDTDDNILNESTTQPPDYVTGQPALVSGPLPLSGRLPTPTADVAGICPCDERRDVCDSNCCCDTLCGDEVAVFTGCLVDSVGSNQQFCSREVASYSLGSTIDGYSILQSSVRRESNSDVFCVQSHNGIDGLSHPSPALPTDSNFDSLFQQFTTFTFSSEVNGGKLSTAEAPAFSGYQVFICDCDRRRERRERAAAFPAPGASVHCVDSNPAAFLMDRSSRCSRHVVLDRDCSTLPALNIDYFSNIQVLAVSSASALVVSVEIASVVLQSVEGTRTELQAAAGKDLHPVLLNSSLCANAVLEVAYRVKYSPAGEILNVTVSLVIGFIQESELPLQQEFQMAFSQQDEITVYHSGNPGYVTGLPLASGTRTVVLTGIVRSINPRNTLSVLYSTGDQDCLRGRHQRSPILFGVDFVSGCTLRITEGANCSLVMETMLNVLRGSNPQYVASFGNSPLEYPLDWLPVRSDFNPGETQSCSVPVSYHLEIKWTKYGSLVNPQAQLVSVKEEMRGVPKALSSGGSDMLPVRSSVAFVAISAAAAPGYRAMPTINAKLPADFFFPFV